VTAASIIAQRLRNQRLIGSPLPRPGGVVAWLGAVQSQDYPSAKWAVGQRGDGLTDADVEQAFNDGEIVRTHVLRPTWHFVAPADIRWMIALTGPRVIAGSASHHRQLELDRRTFARSWKVFERALEGGRHLTRSALGASLTRARIAAAGDRLGQLMMRAELEGLICSGPRVGNQSTYALLDERVPPAGHLSREASIAELARRYFTSHGPATLRDYVWWSGLKVGDARAGIDLVSSDLDRHSCDGLTYWSMGSTSSRRRTVHLLPNYDEYLIAYKDRKHVVGARAAGAPGRRDDMFAHYLIIDGRLAGTWTRTISRQSAVVDVRPYVPLGARAVDILK
jgi:hypothetical protein